MWWIYPIYVALLVLVVWLSIKLAHLVDLLDKKTSISGAFIGGVLLAGVTSLPELFTSISSVAIVRNPGLVIGNILGSDVFNLMIVALYAFIFFKSFKKVKFSKWHLISLLALLAMFGLTAYAVFAPVSIQPMIGDINAISFIILAIYIIVLIKQPKEADKDDEEIDSKLTLKQIIILFIVASLVLIAASIGITYATDVIVDMNEWLSGSIGGAVLLGVATSLPEVISTFELFRKKNLDSGIGNMIGSCTFNFMILAIADLISWQAWNPEVAERGIFILQSEPQQLVIFGVVTILCVFGLLLLKFYAKWFTNKKWSILLAGTLTAIAISGYLLSLIPLGIF